jgi:hypothetical protein
VGEPVAAAFRALGGEAASGYRTEKTYGTRDYDYPIRGTGNADSLDESTLWWEVCVGPSNRVIRMTRGHLGSIPTCIEH